MKIIQPYSEEHYSVFFKFLSDELETLYRESEAEPFKFKFGHRKLLGKWFQSDLGIKNEYSEHMGMAISVFYKVLSDKVETVVWESETEPSRPFIFKVGHRKLLENGFEGTLGSKTNVLRTGNNIFQSFAILSDEVETIFWESEAKHQKLFKSKFGHINVLRKWF